MTFIIFIFLAWFLLLPFSFASLLAAHFHSAKIRCIFLYCHWAPLFATLMHYFPSSLLIDIMPYAIFILFIYFHYYAIFIDIIYWYFFHYFLFSLISLLYLIFIDILIYLVFISDYYIVLHLLIIIYYTLLFHLRHYFIDIYFHYLHADIFSFLLLYLLRCCFSDIFIIDIFDAAFRHWCRLLLLITMIRFIFFIYFALFHTHWLPFFAFIFFYSIDDFYFFWCHMPLFSLLITMIFRWLIIISLFSLRLFIYADYFELLMIYIIFAISWYFRWRFIYLPLFSIYLFHFHFFFITFIYLLMLISFLYIILILMIIFWAAFSLIFIISPLFSHIIFNMPFHYI